MNAKTENETSKFDSVKWIMVAILLVAGVIANSYFSDYAMALRLVGWLLLVAFAILIAFQTSKGRHIWGFIQDAQMELRKVTWPTRQETVQTTLVVIAMVAITALFLWGVDSLLLWIVGLITGQRG